MKFSDLLGDPEPEPESRAEVPAPEADSEPITVFAPEPVTPPETPPRPSASPVSRWADNVVTPATGRSGLAELNVRQPVADAVPGVVAGPDASVSDQLIGLAEVDDDLLPAARRGRK